jgi:hypothetical protein
LVEHDLAPFWFLVSVPGAQVWHSAPSVGENVLTAQSEHVDEPIGDDVPALQFWHAAPPVESSPAEHLTQSPFIRSLPSAHGARHFFAPIAPLVLVPRGQAWHASPSSSEKVLTAQGEHDVAPAGDEVPALHFWHAAPPVEYEPIGQLVQSPFTRFLPSGQALGTGVEQPRLHVWPEGHGLHPF